MRLLIPALAFAGLLLAAAPVLAQDGSSEAVTSPGQLGIVATTPSRIDRSRRELNRGRTQVWRTNMTPTQLRSYAEGALRRGGFQCVVHEALMVAQTSDGTPLVEVDCAEGGGLIIADTNPLQATDCLDLSPATGMAAANGSRINACRLPGNVASVAAEAQSARN